jgi:hypothetical protein
MNRMVRGAIPFLLALIWTGTAFAEAWMQPVGSRYFKVTGSYLYTTEEFDHDGNRIPIFSTQPNVTNTSYQEMVLTGYLEYGLHEKLTLVSKLPFKVLTATQTEITPNADFMVEVEAITGGFSDLELALRTPVMAKPFPLSVQTNLKIPLGYPIQPENGGAPLGSGGIDFDGRLIAGLSLYPFPGYLEASGGYKIRGESLSDEILFALDGGVTWKRLFAKARLEGRYSVNAPQPLDSSVIGQVVDQRELKVMPLLQYSFNDRVAVTAELFHVLVGANTVSGTTYAAGIVLQR